MKLFNDWLSEQRPAKSTNSSLAECCETDFILDAQLDSEMPEIWEFSDLWVYMNSISACDGALEGAVQAWARFKREVPS